MNVSEKAQIKYSVIGLIHKAEYSPKNCQSKQNLTL